MIEQRQRVRAQVAQWRLLQQTEGFNLDEMLMRHTGHFIDVAMELTRGNISEASKLLGLNRTTLYSRMEALQKHKLSEGYPKAREEIH